MKIQDVCKVFTDGDWIESKDQSDIGIRLIQTGNIGEGSYLDKETRAKYISEKTFNSLKCTEIYPGDILVSRLPEPVGRACIVPERAERMITAVDCTICRVDESIITKEYLCYYMRSSTYYNRLLNNVTGTTRKRISRKNLGNVEITVPSLNEQKDVVSRLDLLVSIINSRKQELTKLDDLIKARFVELFSLWSENYEAEPLGDYLEDITYGFTNPMPDSEYGPWKITAKDVVNGIVNFETARKTLQESFDELTAKSKPKVGDVLLTKDGTLGRTAVVEVDGICVNQSVAVLRANDKVLPKYLSLLLQMPKYQGNMMADAGGGTIKHIYITKVVKMPIIVPSIEEQEAFLAFVNQVDKSKVVVQKSLEETQLLFNSLMQEYFG